jgi:hypothetical protein
LFGDQEGSGSIQRKKVQAFETLKLVLFKYRGLISSNNFTKQKGKSIYRPISQCTGHTLLCLNANFIKLLGSTSKDFPEKHIEKKMGRPRRFKLVNGSVERFIPPMCPIWTRI